MADRKIEKTAESDASLSYDPTMVQPEKKRRNKFAFACTVIASMTSILLGYDIGVMSGAVIFIKKDLKITDVQIEVLVGILNIYCLFGSLLAGRTSDWIGRRYTIILAGAIFFAGALLMGFSTNYTFLMVGRFVAGIGVGYALVIAPVYTTEISPTSSRGLLTSLPDVFINAGIMFGYVSNYAFSKLSLHLGWRLMLGVGAIPSVFLAVGVLAMPESPRWLMMQGRLGDAKQVLYKTSDSKEEAESRITDIKEAVGIPENCNDDFVQVQKRSHGEGVWRELLISPTPAVRRVLIAAVGIHFFQQASGIDAVVLYSPRIFQKAGIKGNDPILGVTVAVGFIKTLTILIATFLVDRIGRRRLLLFSSGGVFLSLITLATGLTIIDQNPDKKITGAIVVCIVTVLTFVSFFSTGLGPITWVYSSEIFPLRLRAQGASIGVAFNRITSGVLTMTFISLYKAITIGGAFFLYAGIAAAGWIFYYTFLPETRGQTLEDMAVLFKESRWASKKKGEESHSQVELASNVHGHGPAQL
ncbi:polyol transporter 5-like [Magnolia sinica]|uniref:polyol transporter 5-like n=1 Tax=Magnolia sinica TaxID=86752 RepID=UPI00265AA662|nr:polyol transporter 5-like [Magnolia sinica]